MASPENRSFIEKAAGYGEKAGLVVGVVGLLMLDAPVVALGALAFFASYGIKHIA